MPPREEPTKEMKPSRAEIIALAAVEVLANCRRVSSVTNINALPAVELSKNRIFESNKVEIVELPAVELLANCRVETTSRVIVALLAVELLKKFVVGVVSPFEEF